MNGCDPLFDIRSQIVDKLEDSNDAIKDIEDNVIVAMSALTGAEASAGLCFFAGAPPAIALCAGAAAIAIATSAFAVNYYESELHEAVAALEEAQGALDQIDEVIGHCEALETWQEDDAEDIFNEAPDPDSVPDPRYVDSGYADDAVAALDVLEEAFRQTDQTYA
jgi:hypothetical protein